MGKRDLRKRELFIIAAVCLIGCIFIAGIHLRPEEKITGTQAALPSGVPESKEQTAEPSPSPTVDPTEKMATFFQGPKSWKERRVWSGEWGDSCYDGGNFGGFGCGLCCMANIYTSLTPYECSPLDMYRYAKKASGYGGGGAIDWGYIKETLRMAGFTSDVFRKPRRYETFQKAARETIAMIAVVSSQNSTCYWKDTPGHYVTILAYDEKKDRIFLGDSGDPSHNRQWVPLKKIYQSLKTANRWQYLAVTAYDRASDQWKHHGFGGVCILPEGFP